MAGWSSLPADLINRVADRLLATDDLDYYMDFRGVCHSWRSSTADPKSSSPRFQPRQWAMLDEVYKSDDTRLFVNTGTGRFVRKDLPLLRRRYFVVAGATGGSIVLADRASPHAASILNPFTGSLVRFVAPVPKEMDVVAHVIGGSSSPPTLILRCDKSGTIYYADPNRECFLMYKEKYYYHPLVKQALVGGIYAAAAHEPVLFQSVLGTESNRILDLVPTIGEHANCPCFLVESAGEMLIVFKLQHRIEVFKIDPISDLVVMVKDIGSRALFVGDCRCLSVEAQKFPSVEANCIYHVIDEPMYDICVYSLKDDKEVVAGGAIDSFNPNTLSPLASPPFTVVQLLCSYTFELRGSEIQWENMFTQLSGMDMELLLVALRNFWPMIADQKMITETMHAFNNLHLLSYGCRRPAVECCC